MFTRPLFSDRFGRLQREFRRNVGLAAFGGTFKENNLFELVQPVSLSKAVHPFHFFVPQDERGLKRNRYLAGIAQKNAGANRTLKMMRVTGKDLGEKNEVVNAFFI